MRHYGTLVLGTLSFAAALIHPPPWCIGCETTIPFGHRYTPLDDVVQGWFILVPLLVGLLKLDKGWLTSPIIVAAQIAGQFVGGESWRDFTGNEGPLIVMLGLPVCVLSLLVGVGCRYCYDRVGLSN